MDGRKSAWVAAALACALGGCGTIGNLSDPKQTRPFGGVLRDANASAWLVNEASEASKKPAAEVAGLVLAVPVVTVDLPLSFVADTVTLPLTIPMSVLRQGQPEMPPPQAMAGPPMPDGGAYAPVGPTPVSNYVPAPAPTGQP